MSLRSIGALLSVFTCDPVTIKPMGKEDALSAITFVILTAVYTLLAMRTILSCRGRRNGGISLSISLTTASKAGVFFAAMWLTTVRAAEELGATCISRMTPPIATLTKGNTRSGFGAPNSCNRMFELNSTIEHGFSPST